MTKGGMTVTNRMVGYRALIVDNEVPASRLAQFLMRPDLNNKTISTFSIADLLPDAVWQADQFDFIYIDPFYFGLREAVRFIADIQARPVPKAITIFRSGRQWLEHQHELDGHAIPAERLRHIPALDKDMLADAAFEQLVRANIMAMVNAYQIEAQRYAFERSGVGTFTERDFSASASYPNVLYGASRYGDNMLVPVPQHQPPTHAVVVSAPQIDLGLMQQQLLQTQTLLDTLRQAHGKMQEDDKKTLEQIDKLKEQTTKMQEQLNVALRQQHDVTRTSDSTNQRIDAVEAHQSRLDERIAKLTQRADMGLYLLIGSGVVTLLLLALVIISYIRHP
jgi:hypothetical protein